MTITDGTTWHKQIPVDASGNFSIDLTIPTTGIYKYQASAPSGEKFLGSSSPFVTVVVR